jgi:uncharacterized protein YcbX
VGRVVSLHIYPFKSAGGFTVTRSEVDPTGFRDDRRWMAVDGAGRFVSQRTHPAMALLSTRFDGDSLELSAPGREPLRLPRTPPESVGHEVLPVWASERYAQDCGPEAARWMSAWVGSPCRVMRAVRPPGLPLFTDERRVRGSFADACPALVVSAASLRDLNGRLDAPLPMDRFRPNLVVEGLDPYEEDHWGRGRIGAVSVRGGWPCVRCATTLVDQSTAEKGLEPLRTLATYRASPAGGVTFGMNLFFDEAGTVEVGDQVETGGLQR